jgi:zinc protease
MQQSLSTRLCTCLRRVGLANALALAAILPLAAATPAQAQAQAPAVADPKVPHERYMLDNGLEVLLISDRRVPLVAVDVWYHVGSGDEVVGKSGFAHLFEHMMFQGAKHIGEDVHFDTLRKAGASEINGTTNTDRTNYFEVVPSHQIETALWLESDRMGWLLDKLGQKSLDNQRDVVRNERRQRYDNVPYGKDRFAIQALLYPEGHPYRYLTIGLHEDLERASLDDVRRFFQTWYVPANATVCLAGDFDLPEGKRLIQKWFGSFPRSAKPKRRLVATPEVQAAEQTVRDPLAKLRRLHLAWHSPAIYASGDAELDILAHALGTPGTGRLYKKLVHELQLAQSVTVYQASAQLSSSFHVIVDLRPGADLAKVREVLAAELETARTTALTDAEVRRAIVGVENSVIWGLEALLSRAELLQSYAHYLGKTDALGQDLARYRNAKPDQITAVAARVLAPTKQVTVVTEPETAP